jgi:competence protein ComEC
VKLEILHPSVQSYEDTAIKDYNRSCVLKVNSQSGGILHTRNIEKADELELINLDVVN